MANVILTPAIGGYDVVSYIKEDEAKKGDPAFNVTYKDTIYFFSSPENKETFEADPEQYIPAYGGYCATAMSEGKVFGADPENFKVVNNRTFLFYNGVGGDTLSQWNESEAERLANADKHWNNETYELHG